MVTRRHFLGACCTGLAAGVMLYGQSRGPGVDLLVDQYRKASRTEVLDLAVQHLHSGVPVRDLLCAAFLLPILTGGDVGDVHASMVVPAIMDLVAQTPTAHAGLPVVWALSNAHAWSRVEKIQRHVPALADPGGALSQALEQGDADAADAAAATMLSQEGEEPVMRGLLLEATRPRTDPHAAIFAAHVHRMAPQWNHQQHGHAALRALARHLAVRRPLVLETSAPPPTGAHPDWSDAVAQATGARMAETTTSGPGVHQVTLLEALVHLWRAAHGPDQVTAFSRAQQWLAHAAAQQPSAALPLENAAQLAGSEAVRLARARVVEHGADPHDFKYLWAVANLVADPATRAAVAASALLSPSLFVLRADWPERAAVGAALGV